MSTARRAHTYIYTHPPSRGIRLPCSCISPMVSCFACPCHMVCCAREADCPPPVCRHIEVSPDRNGNLFFWHFQNKHIANKQRTVIWINGGPGCSSEDGVLMEIGPYRLKDGHTLQYNDGAWNEFANVLFVDNPVGTGFSYVNNDSYVSELDDMADQFVTFLEKWYALFPEYEHDEVTHPPPPSLLLLPGPPNSLWSR